MLKGFFVAGPFDDGDPVTGHYYETASNDAERAQVWGYTDRLSYLSGDDLVIHAISNAPKARLTIFRDALNPELMFQTEIIGGFAETSGDCSVKGCNWPGRFRVTIPPTWRSGVYTFELSVPGHSSEGMFVVRSAHPQAKILMLLATGTWCAYNDWGGSNHYQGLTGPRGDDFAAEVSMHRPWATGFVRWPEDAPRITHASPLLRKPEYPHMEYARSNGLSKKYASSGWAAFEKPFALWCEEQGINLDFATQHDLHSNSQVADGYERMVIVGHDEYWTWEMRDHLDTWVDQGGQLARFAGNFFWQTRLSDDLTTQVCYKYRAPSEDPTCDPRRLTNYWDNPKTCRPAIASMGLTGSMGVYAGWSRCAANGVGGFILYRPEHWCLTDSGLGYGDVLGRDSRIFAYEVDGIDYTMRQGLPFPVDGKGLEGELTIVGLSPATTLSHSTGPHDRDPFIGSLDAEEVALNVYGEVTAETVARAARGNGCMAEYRRGSGAVFNAASCEWVAGLIARDAPVERVTRRVLTGDWS